MENEEVKDQGESVDVETKEVSVDDKIAQMKAELEADFAKREADYKTKISKLDRVITEKDREKLSEVERMKAEKADIEAEKEQLKKESEMFRRKLAVDSALNEVGLPLDLADRIKGDSEDDIKADVLGLKAYFDNLINKSAETQISNALKGKAPERQESSEKLTAEQIAEIPNRADRIKAYKNAGMM